MAKYESKDVRAVRVVFEGNPNYVKVSHTPDGRVVVQASLGDNLVDSVEVQADERPKESAAKEETDLSGLSKNELVDLAETRGVEYFESWTKDEIIAAIESEGE